MMNKKNCCSHSAYWLPTGGKYFTLHGGQSRLWSSKQGKYTKNIKSGSAPPPAPTLMGRTRKNKKQNKTRGAYYKEKKIKKIDRGASRDASACLGATQVLVHLVPVQDSFGSSTRPIIGVALQVYTSVYGLNFPSLVGSLFSWRCLLRAILLQYCI